MGMDMGFAGLSSALRTTLEHMRKIKELSEVDVLFNKRMKNLPIRDLSINQGVAPCKDIFELQNAEAHRVNHVVGFSKGCPIVSDFFSIYRIHSCFIKEIPLKNPTQIIHSKAYPRKC
jgi:hypothetical protein